ncbi:MAG: alanine--tRNA ligase, partial [Fretibacterium sp.]|nr:alanine--tRNA ligase [Fretibacterium sp.]
RVIADHVRSVAFMLADGVLPSNDGPGYVLRRLLRRAVRFGKLLGFDGPFLCEYLPILIDLMGEPYRELITQRPTIEQIITVEEERFQKTLQQGTDLFEEAVKGLSAGGRVPGEVAFTLYDTYGFPPELTREMAEEKGLTVDEEGFAAAMEGQRQRARASSKQKHSALAGDIYTELENEFGPTRFTGYEASAGKGKIVALLTPDGRVDKIDQAPSKFELILDTTPFYAERGGEVGDTGRMTVDNATLEVLNTVPRGGIIVHTVRLAELAGPASIAVGETVSCQVDEERRSAIRRNHTSTHLLHEALGRVLGRHVRQAGSLVADEFLRFDFTHHSPMTDAEIAEVERIVNRQILANTPVTTREYRREEAQKLGAKALFEEKYGDVVRVVTVPQGGLPAEPEDDNRTFSMELCGGLHVQATGDIGSFKILREESVGSGTRRILAATGMNVLVLLQKLFGLRSAMTALLATDEEGLKDKAQGLVDDLRRMKNELQAVKLRELTENSERFLERREVGNVLLQMGRFPGAQLDVLRKIGDKAKARPEPTVTALASIGEDESCQLVVMADDRAVKLGVNAGALVKEASVILGGKGGGRPTTAQGGGKDGAKLSEALARIEALLKKQVGVNSGEKIPPETPGA